MESLNFDYFVKRGTVLTEMARKTTDFSDENVVAAYRALRQYFSKKYGIKNSNTINVYTFHYIYDVLYDLLPEEVIDSVVGPKLTHDGDKIKTVVAELVRIALAEGVITPQELTVALQDFDKFDKLVPMIKANAGNRARGHRREVLDVTGASHDEFLNLTKQTETLRREMNNLMRGRNVSKAKLGDKSKYLQPSPESQEDLIDPNVQNAINISNILGTVSNIRSKMRDSGELDDKTPASMWAAKDETSVLKTHIKALSDKEFEETVGGLMNLIEQKIDSGVGQTTQGFTKLVASLQALPNYSPHVIAILQYVLQKLQDYTPEISNSEEQDFAGYDTAVVNKVLDTPEKLDVFKDWLEIYTLWRDEKDRKLTEKYLEKQSNVQAAIQAAETGEKSDDMKSGIDAFWAKRNKEEPKTREFKMKDQTNKNSSGDVVQNAKDKIESYGESVMSYMEEQVSRDSKFTGAINGKFVDKGYKRFKNYNHWLTENE